MIRNEYFNWLYDLVCGKRYSKQVSYKKLLKRMYDTEFRCVVPRDGNRAADGVDLRYRFTITHDHDEIYKIDDRPCSVLEMMVALAIRCEEEYMDDASYGDRTGQWFWGMVVNLGLGSMIDSRFDAEFVDEVLDRFIDRDYEPDGKGGLFTVKNCPRDLRDMEIWQQMCWYLNTIV